MRGSKAQSPLIIYIVETNHRDMSYSSLLRKVIEDCGSKDLSTKVFSEYESQTYKVNGMTHAANGDNEKAIDGVVPANIDEQLRVLINAPSSKETHIQTTEFLDSRFITMGGVKQRWRELVPETWENLPKEVKEGTPENLLRHFEERGAIDDPAILKMMRDDVTEGDLPKEDDIIDASTNSKSYYRYWGGCLNYELIHKGMAQDVKEGLAGKPTPDVIIMIAGKEHIQGLSQQFDLHLPEFTDSQKVVIRNSKEVVIDEKIGALIEFKFATEKREAHIPDSLNKMISERSLSKNITSPSEHLSPKRSLVERMRSDATKGKSQGGI